MAHTAEDGKIYQTKFYRLEAILAVGYRVNSVQATDFRSIWDHILKVVKLLKLAKNTFFNNNQPVLTRFAPTSFERCSRLFSIRSTRWLIA